MRRAWVLPIIVLPATFLAACGSSPVKSSSVTTMAPKPAPTLTAVVAAIKGAGLGVCDTENDQGGPQTALSTVTLTIDGCGSGAPLIWVSVYSNEDAAQAAATGAGGGIAAWSVGDLAIEGFGLTSGQQSLVASALPR